MRSVAALSFACVFCVAGDALAQPSSPPAAPGADRIRSAAAEYDAGRRAFTDAKFEEAAIHFENAYHDAPRAEALRNAIRARKEAKQFARAATLAALAESSYAEDAPTMVLVRETLAESAPKLHKVTLLCSPACGVTADGRAVALDDTSKLAFYLSPGAHDLVVSWPGDRLKAAKVNAVAGGEEELKLEAPPLVLTAVVGPAMGPVGPAEPPPAKEKPLGPVVFFIAAGVTVLGAGATILSGIDAKNNPGVDAVRRDCAGMGESCPTYQKGRDAQFRTNVILGGTIGAGAITAVVGTFFTRWSTARREPNRAAFAPFAAFGSASGTAGVRGSF